jgi:hypothetical protein
MKRTSSFGLMTRLGVLTGRALLRDMFESVNNRVNGFERHLKTGRYTGHGRITGYNPKNGRAQYDGTRGNTTDFSGKRHGEQERQRRLRRMQRAGMLSVVSTKLVIDGKPATALARNFDGKRVSIQMDKMSHLHSHGWHPYNAAHWALRPDRLLMRF